MFNIDPGPVAAGTLEDNVKAITRLFLSTDQIVNVAINKDPQGDVNKFVIEFDFTGIHPFTGATAVVSHLSGVPITQIGEGIAGQRTSRIRLIVEVLAGKIRVVTMFPV